MLPAETSSRFEALPGIAHGFFGRRGGTSATPFDTLNVSESCGDDPDAVAQNRLAIARHLGIASDRLTTARQTHSTIVLTLDAPTDPASRPEADALVTNQPGLALGILTADCVPVLFADPHAGIIGAAHAGWRGALDGILGNAIAAMLALGASAQNIHAAIGPHIMADDYEVGPDFARDFLGLYPEGAAYLLLGPTGREHFDLTAFCHAALSAHGVTQVETVGPSTLSAPDRYFSHRHATRRGEKTGRQMSVIVRR